MPNIAHITIHNHDVAHALDQRPILINSKTGAVVFIVGVNYLIAHLEHDFLATTYLANSVGIRVWIVSGLNGLIDCHCTNCAFIEWGQYHYIIFGVFVKQRIISIKDLHYRFITNRDKLIIRIITVLSCANLTFTSIGSYRSKAR